MHEVIRRGDYYEIQIIDRDTAAETKKKPEQPNLNIVTDNVTQAEALAKFSLPPKMQITDSRIASLRQQLRQIEKQLARDPKADANELHETKELLVELAAMENFDPIKVDIAPFKKELVTKPQQDKSVEYKLVVPVSTSLQDRVRRLEEVDYPRMSKIEQLTSVLVGEHLASEEKLNKSKHPNKLESKSALFNRFQKLESTIEQFPQLVQRINNNESIHCEIAHTVQQFRNVTALHHELLEELGQDSSLVGKLAANFQENKKKLTATIGNFRERLAKLKKK